MDLHISALFLRANALVMVIYRHRQHHFGSVLADYILIQYGLELGGFEQLLVLQAPAASASVGDVLFFIQQILADLNTFVADIGARAGDDASHFLLRPAAETAMNILLFFGHDIPLIYMVSIFYRWTNTLSIRP